MNTFIGWGLSFTFFILGISIPTDNQTSEEIFPTRTVRMVKTSFQALTPLSTPKKAVDKPKIQFMHGDVSWLPELALKSGWDIKQISQLAQIILRESGGCPNRRGGDKVDKNCNITGVSEWNHRSDSGLLQINGVNYDTARNKWAPICREMDICSKDDQWKLLDAATNLEAGLILYNLVGWAPWDPCAWGPDFAHRCNKKTKP